MGYVETQFFALDELQLDCGKRLTPVTIAFETYGSLNTDKTNAILVCHALSGDAHAAGYHAAEDRPGWWDQMIGPGKALDTSRYFVICSNVIGGCKGSTGPSSENPKTGRPYGLDFPLVTIRDMVRAQKKLVEHLGIKELLSVVGGSMGGMQVLQWAVSYPELIRSAIPIATTARHSAQQIAFDEVGRQAIMADPQWKGGYYYGDEIPAKGLAVARMVGHITYMSDKSMREKFGRQLVNGDSYAFCLSAPSIDFRVGDYLKNRGNNFIQRFDANSYLYITKAMDYFDLSEGKPLVDAFRGARSVRFLVLAFSSDWLYPSYQSREIVSALKANGVDVTFCEIQSTYGHDAFLIETEEQTRLISAFLRHTHERC